jgi:hypothetical protein
MMKQFCVVFVFALLIIIQSFTTKTDLFSDDIFSENNFDMQTSDDNISLLFDIDSGVESYLEQSAGMTKNHNPLTILILLNSIGIMDVLRAPFFLKTSMLGQKSTLDRPMADSLLFLQKRNTMVCMPELFVEYLSTSDEFFSDYFATGASNFLDALQNSLELIRGFNFTSSPLQNIDLDVIFNLLSKIIVEQRTVGATFLLSHSWENYCFRALWNIKYIERNFFLPDEDLDALLAEFDEAPSEDESFTKNHLVSDKVGLGDIRLELEAKGFESLTNAVNYGGFLDIPSGFTLKKGLYGTNFPVLSAFPPFDFDILYQAGLDQTVENQNRAFDFLSQLLLNGLDRIAANILHTDMGNFPHIGLGVFLTSKTRLSYFLPSRWTHRVILKNYISFQVFSPGPEHVFYTTKIDQAEIDQFDLEGIIDRFDREEAAEALHFIERRIIESFFLRAFSSVVQPGFVFRWSSAFLIYLSQASRFSIGSEFYYKGRDHILRIHAPKDVRDTLDRDNASRKSIRETILFAKYSHKKILSTGTLLDFFVGLQATSSMDTNTLTGYEMTIGWKVEF